MGRATIRIRADEIADIDFDKITGMCYVILEGQRYPNWQAGTEPMCVISDYTIQDALCEIKKEHPGYFKHHANSD